MCGGWGCHTFPHIKKHDSISLNTISLAMVVEVKVASSRTAAGTDSHGTPRNGREPRSKWARKNQSAPVLRLHIRPELLTEPGTTPTPALTFPKLASAGQRPVARTGWHIADGCLSVGIRPADIGRSLRHSQGSDASNALYVTTRPRKDSSPVSCPVILRLALPGEIQKALAWLGVF